MIARDRVSRPTHMALPAAGYERLHRVLRIVVLIDSVPAPEDTPGDNSSSTDTSVGSAACDRRDDYAGRLLLSVHNVGSFVEDPLGADEVEA